MPDEIKIGGPGDKPPEGYPVVSTDKPLRLEPSDDPCSPFGSARYMVKLMGHEFPVKPVYGPDGNIVRWVGTLAVAAKDAMVDVIIEPAP